MPSLTLWRGKMTHAADKEIGGVPGTTGSTGRLLERDPVLFDHFINLPTRIGTGATDWTQTETGGATTGHVAFIQSIASTNSGYATGTGGQTSGQEEIAGKNVVWAPATMAGTQYLSMEARVKVIGATTATDGDFGIGFADAVTYGAAPFVVSATSTLTSTGAVDWAGFYYSSLATSGALFGIVGFLGSKNSTKSAVNATTLTKDSLFHTYRVDIDASGNATGFIDGEQTGFQPACVTAATALTPYITVIGTATHANAMSIDYIWVGGSRV
jgi:hypothetical protein